MPKQEVDSAKHLITEQLFAVKHSDFESALAEYHPSAEKLHKLLDMRCEGAEMQWRL